MLTSDFEYELPPERIAQTPPPERGASRMLVLHAARETWEHRGIADLGEYLRPPDTLVLNDTRVLAARLFGRRCDTGGRVEILLIEPIGPDHWRALCRTRGRLAVGGRLDLAEGCLRAEISAMGADGQVELRLASEVPLEAVLEAHGLPPLPPYIRRERGAAARPEDRERYQTVYARRPGAVAAPTAGLHFSAAHLATLRERGIATAMLTLHVGLGTFRPVQTDAVAAHVMEAERYALDAAAAATIRAARAGGGRVVAVGSTSVRTLETVAAEHGQIVPAQGRSALFIHPPHAFQAVDALLTNFHLPRSTLVMMVAAFAGWRMGATAPGDDRGRQLVLAAYTEAIRAGYRFYSYGDCMLIL